MILVFRCLISLFKYLFHWIEELQPHQSLVDKAAQPNLDNLKTLSTLFSFSLQVICAVVTLRDQCRWGIRFH